MDKRKRPERQRKYIDEMAQATGWYFEECKRRGLDRDEALAGWEALSPQARIRRWKAAVRTKAAAARVFDEIPDALIDRVSTAMKLPPGVKPELRETQDSNDPLREGEI